MTREEAIKHIKDIICENNSIKPRIVTFEQEKEALYMAISALEQNESAEEWYKLFVEKFESCEDAISREDATAEFIKWQTEVAYAFGRDYLGVRIIQSAIDTIRELPSVTQKSDNKYRKEAKRWKNKWLKSHKSGHWIRYKENCCYNKCSICEYEHCTESNYCPNCGAKMESEDKE